MRGPGVGFVGAAVAAAAVGPFFAGAFERGLDAAAGGFGVAFGAVDVAAVGFAADDGAFDAGFDDPDGADFLFVVACGAARDPDPDPDPFFRSLIVPTSECRW